MDNRLKAIDWARAQKIKDINEVSLMGMSKAPDDIEWELSKIAPRADSAVIHVKDTIVGTTNTCVVPLWMRRKDMESEVKRFVLLLELERARQQKAKRK
jgi:hypothetical protein